MRVRPGRAPQATAPAAAGTGNGGTRPPPDPIGRVAAATPAVGPTLTAVC
ncbi:hypothetical protein ACFWWT_22005 [Streptomyces sp. NPDC058676]